MNREHFLPTIAFSATSCSSTSSTPATSQQQYLQFNKALEQFSVPAPVELKRPKSKLPEDFKPSDNDVICGKGKNVFSHEGNRRFRQLVEISLDRYNEANTRGKKTQVVQDIVEMVRMNSNNGGGFVRQDKSGRWWEIGSQCSKEKVGHTIRESLMHNEPHKKDERRKLRAYNKARRTARKKKQKPRLSSCKPPITKSLLDDDDSGAEEEEDSMQLVAMRVADVVQSSVSDEIPKPAATHMKEGFSTEASNIVSEELEEDIPPPPPRGLFAQSSRDWFSPGEQHLLGSMPAHDDGFEESSSSSWYSSDDDDDDLFDM